MSARKDPERRQGRDTKDTVLEIVPDGMASGYFPLPKLGGRRPLKATADAWEAYWRSSLPQMLTSADHPALVRMFDLYDQRERLSRAWAKQPFVTGSTGQVVVNPASKTVVSLDKTIVQLEDRFGITPLARMRLGIALGEAARTLDDLNADFEDDLGESPVDDPRVVDVRSREA